MNFFKVGKASVLALGDRRDAHQAPHADIFALFGLLRRLPLFLQALLLCGLLTLLLLPQWKLQKVVSTKNSKLSLLKVLHLS